MADHAIIIHRGRTVIVSVDVGMDVSTDVLTSEIRTEEDSESDLIATWQVTFLTDGTDGELVLTMDDSVTQDIEHSNGFMDLQRYSGGEPLSVFSKAIPVSIRGKVTV